MSNRSIGAGRRLSNGNSSNGSAFSSHPLPQGPTSFLPAGGTTLRRVAVALAAATSHNGTFRSLEHQDPEVKRTSAGSLSPTMPQRTITAQFHQTEPTAQHGLENKKLTREQKSPLPSQTAQPVDDVAIPISGSAAQPAQSRTRTTYTAATTPSLEKKGAWTTEEKIGYGIASAVSPVTFAFQAGASRLKKTTLNENSGADFMAISGGEKFFSAVLAGSSYTINVASNWAQIRTTCHNVYNRIEDFDYEKEGFLGAFKLGTMLAVATGSALSLGTLGVGTLSFAGAALAITNGLLFGPLSWIQRFNALDSIDKRIQQFFAQGDYESLLERLSSDPDALHFLATHCTNELNQIFNPNSGDAPPVDSKMVYQVLTRLLEALRKNPEFKINETSTLQKRLRLLNWGFATLVACCIAPVFAEKFLKGMGAFENLFNSSLIRNSNSSLKTIIAYFFSSGTPLMYLNAVSKFPYVAIDAIKSIRNPAYTKKERRIAHVKAGGYALAGVFAASSGYNLIEGPLWQKLVGGAGVFGTNGNFVFDEEHFPHPERESVKPTTDTQAKDKSDPKTPLLQDEQKSDSAVITILQTTEEITANHIKACAEHLSKNRLSDEAIHLLKLREIALDYSKNLTQSHQLPADAINLELKEPQIYAHADQPKKVRTPYQRVVMPTNLLTRSSIFASSSAEIDFEETNSRYVPRKLSGSDNIV